MEIICYAGGRGEFPENTIEGISHCQSINKNWRIEVDLQMTKDGEIILFHDDTTDRTTELTAHVNELYFDQVSKLNAAYNFQKDGEYLYRSDSIKIPRLRSVLQDFSDTKLLLDIHTSNILSVVKIINIIESKLNNANNIVIVSKYDFIIDKFKALRPDWSYGAATKEAKSIVYSSFIRMDNSFPLQSDVLMLPKYLGKIKILSSRIIQHVKNRDKKLWAWVREGKTVECVNTMDVLHSYKDLGIDGIFTDYPSNLTHEKLLLTLT